MWNNNLAVADDTARGKNVASEAAASTYVAKRQRRPSVRLEELGDQHADRTKVCSPLHDLHSPTNSSENLNISPNILKIPSRRVGSSAQKDEHLQGRNPDVEKASCYSNGLPKQHSKSQIRQLLRTTSKKGKVGRKPKVPKLTTSTKKVPSVPLLGKSVRTCRKDKVPCMPAAKGMHFDKENNAHPSAGFIALAYQNSESISDEIEQNGVMMLNSHHQEAVRDYLSTQAQAMGGRTSQWVHPSGRRQASEVIDGTGGKCLAEEKGSVGGPRGKIVIRNGWSHGVQNRLVMDANRGGNSMEPTENHKLHIGQRCRPLLGVRQWLHNLGLGNYIKLFEAHEVEPEVLPLLTFEDLKEMGVFAVGPRRKMFYAIQQFRKAMLPEAN